MKTKTIEEKSANTTIVIENWPEDWGCLGANGAKLEILARKGLVLRKGAKARKGNELRITLDLNTIDIGERGVADPGRKAEKIDEKIDDATKAALLKKWGLA